MLGLLAGNWLTHVYTDHMEETVYQALADVALSSIENAFRDIDVDVVDCERSGDVITLLLKGGTRCVINTQRPTRQIWMAAEARGWHFSYDPHSKRWIDDKGHGLELFAQLAAIVKNATGEEIVV